MRVNARFEGVAEQQVSYLATSTGLKVSDVLRDSVDFYYRHIRSQGTQLKHLSKWIGKGDSGQSDIASNIKSYLDEGLATKYGPATVRERPARRPKPAK